LFKRRWSQSPTGNVIRLVTLALTHSAPPTHTSQAHSKHTSKTAFEAREGWQRRRKKRTKKGKTTTTRTRTRRGGDDDSIDYAYDDDNGGEHIEFRSLLEGELRQWVEVNPGRVDDRDKNGETPLYMAARSLKSLSLTVWLLDKKGANVNATTSSGSTALRWAESLDILTAL